MTYFDVDYPKKVTAIKFVESGSILDIIYCYLESNGIMSYCGNCGNEIESDWQFCPYCGGNIL